MEKLQGGFVGKADSGGVFVGKKPFLLPKYGAEYALSGEKVGEPLMFPQLRHLPEGRVSKVAANTVANTKIKQSAGFKCQIFLLVSFNAFRSYAPMNKKDKGHTIYIRNKLIQ